MKKIMASHLTSLCFFLLQPTSFVFAGPKGLPSFLKADGYDEIVLRKNAVGHFEFEAKINGVVGLFTLDTGASSTVLDKERAKKFKLPAANKDVQAGGLGTSTQAAQLTSLKSVVIGKYKTSDLTIALLDLSAVNESLKKHGVTPQDGVVGADILNSGDAVIDYKSSRLYLKTVSVQ